MLWVIPCIMCGTYPASGQDALSYNLLKIALNQDVQQIKIHEFLPGKINEKIIQFPDDSIDLDTLIGRRVIFDFWNTYCSACIGALYKIQKLQKQFKDSVFIIPVTYQSRASVKQFFSMREKMGRPINLPSVVEDTLLRKLFPHQADPYEVWMNRDGKVIGFTGDAAISEKVIQNFIDKGYLENQPERLAFYKPFESDKPLLVNGYGASDSCFIYRSLITHYLDSFPTQQALIDTGKVHRIFLTNQTVIDLYKFAYSNLSEGYSWLERDPMNKRVRFIDNLKNKGRYHFEALIKNQEIDNNDLYCYDLTLPDDFDKTEMLKAMIEDINRFFKLKSSIETFKIPCFYLTYKSTKKIRGPIYSKSYLQKLIAANAGKLISLDNSQIILAHRSISDLVSALNNCYTFPIIIDKTNYTQPLDIVLNFKQPELENIKSELSKYSLYLTPSTTTLSILVLTSN